MSEQLQSDRFNEIEEVSNLLKIGNFKRLFRVNYQGQRLYVDPEPFSYYSGLTGALSASRFQGDMGGKILGKWRDKMIENYGKSGLDNYVGMTAEFGSLVHTALVDIKNDGKVIWSEQREKAEAHFEQEYRKRFSVVDPSLIKQMAYEYQKHVASIMQFIYERVSEIHAIETPAVWQDLKIATPIDIVCDCRQTPKGDFYRSAINIKTSNQISNEHLEQVSVELAMWNETYGEKPVVAKEDGGTSYMERQEMFCDYAGILRTKDWREDKAPTFEYKGLSREDTSDYVTEAHARMYLALLSKTASYYPEPTSKLFVGETIPGQAPEVLVTTLEQDWSELWTEMQERETLKEESNGEPAE